MTNQGWKTAVLGAAVAVLVALGGMTATALRPASAPAAPLDTTPTPTTTPTPEPSPTPDPSPTPQPKPPPKPAPKPTPKPPPPPVSQPTPAPVTHTPAPAPTPAPPSTPAVTPRPTVVPHAKPKTHPRPRHHVIHHHHKAVIAPITQTQAPPLPTQPASSSLGPTKTSSVSPLRPVIIAALCAAFALFGVAAMPARVVPWRRASYFLYERHLQFTLFGLVLLAAAAFAILLTKA